MVGDKFDTQHEKLVFNMKFMPRLLLIPLMLTTGVPVPWGPTLPLQFYVQLTEQDCEAGYVNVSGVVFASFRSQEGDTSMVARAYTSTQQIWPDPALEVNIALAPNQSAWISSAGAWFCTTHI
jgi:hypothetical protein